MKKFFLIPLLACSFCVMAWGTVFPVGVTSEPTNEIQSSIPAKIHKAKMDGNAARINDQEYATLDAALEAAQSGDVITLLADRTGSSAITVSANVTLTSEGESNFTINCEEIDVLGATTITLQGVNFQTKCGFVQADGHDLTINLAEGSENYLDATSFCCFYASNTSSLFIVGNGSFTVERHDASYGGKYGAFYIWNNITLAAPNLSVDPDRLFEHVSGTVAISGGSFKTDPYTYLADPVAYLVSYNDPWYSVVSAGSVVAYNQGKYAAYNSLQAAVDAAEDGDRIIMYNSDNTAVEISKNLVIDNGEFSINVSAGASYAKVGTQDRTVITNNALVAYLQGDETAQHVVSASTDISAMGQIIVKGTKSISIADEVVVTCKKQLAGASIIVPNGASLTIEGDGTIASDEGLINVEKGGVLTVGKADKSDQPKFTTSVNARVNHVLVNNGNATINNAKMTAKSAAIHNNGVLTVLGGLYTGEASTANAHKYCVTTDSGSKMTLKNATVKGVHGAVACQAIYGNESSATIDNCTLIATDSPNGVKANNGAVHYGLYVATLSVVSVYNTKIYSTAQAYCAYIGDNDAFTTFGLIYLYDGCLLKQKMFVQQKRDRDDDLVFPVSISKDSEWYKVASKAGGGFGPLPTGYAYRAIIAEGEPTAEQVLDAEAYGEGYRWKVVSTADPEQQKEASDDPEATIPWQQSSTWDATAESTSTADVPTEESVVTIPEGKTVVISADENENNGVTTAEANQVFLSEESSLSVEGGTTLNVTGGINIAAGAELEIAQGAVVTVGEGGIIAADDNNIVLSSSEDNYSSLLLAPTVTENTQPKATFVFHSKAKQLGGGKCVWQRFGIPTFDGATTMSWETSDRTFIYEFDYDANAWKQVHNSADNFVTTSATGRAFQCYNMTIDGTEEVEYTFTGNLMGNTNAPLDFVFGWNYYANSYTAPIDIEEFINEIVEHFGGNVSATVYVYNRSSNWWDAINLAKLLIGTAPQTKIRPMQAFILELLSGDGETQNINYERNVYNPIVNPGSVAGIQARRAQRTSDFNAVVISATNGSQNDELTLFEMPSLTDEFDNGWDATKFTENTEFNIYCKLEDKKLGTLATNDLSNKFIAFDAKVAGEYTLNFSDARGDEISLYDAVADSTIVMKDGESYKFTAEAINDAERFIINKKDAPSAIDEVENVVKATKFIGVDGQLYIRRSGRVYDVQGKEIKK